MFSKLILLIIKFIYDKLYVCRALNIYFVYISKFIGCNSERRIESFSVKIQTLEMPFKEFAFYSSSKILF